MRLVAPLRALKSAVGIDGRKMSPEELDHVDPRRLILEIQGKSSHLRATGTDGCCRYELDGETRLDGTIEMEGRAGPIELNIPAKMIVRMLGGRDVEVYVRTYREWTGKGVLE